jgi:CheY-like chemotaxis protein
MANILVVDDQPVNREVLATLLQSQGHTILEASHGGEALDIVRSENPDLVITDVLVPVMDGYEFVRPLRSDPTLNEIPVIFYSANRPRGGSRERRVGGAGAGYCTTPGLTSNAAGS